MLGIRCEVDTVRGSGSHVNNNASPEEMVTLISQHEVFAGFDPTEREQLRSIVSYRHAEADDVLFEIDDPPDTLFFLVDGALTLEFPDNSKLDIPPHELIGEIGVLNGDFRLGRLVAEQHSNLIALATDSLFDADVIDPSVSLKIVRRLSRRVTNYLRSKQQTSSRELIAAGETDHVEFKSTLRWNLRAERKDPKITHAVLKTIAAFLNSDGGTLMVGVADDGTIVGLDHDDFENDDRLLLFLTDVIKSKLGTLHLDDIHYHTEQVDDKTFLRVDVQPSSTPCYVIDDQNDRFYVRTGPSTTDLRLSELYDFINKRFG